ILAGNAGANKLDDGGGASADTMDGGAGNDTYFVHNANDQVSETGKDKAGGTGTVFSAEAFKLGGYIENHTLAAGALVGAGNELTNVMTASDGANLLDGGAGADTMSGGKDNDEYKVDNSKDVVIETLAAAAQGGNDIVVSTATFTLGANIE